MEFGFSGQLIHVSGFATHHTFLMGSHCFVVMESLVWTGSEDVV